MRQIRAQARRLSASVPTVVVAAAAAAVVTACGSSSHATTAAQQTATSSQSSGAGSASGNAALKQAQAIAAAYSKPQQPPPLTPLSKPATDKKLLAFITCSDPVCEQLTQGLATAAKVGLGWPYKDIVTDGTSEGIIKSWSAAMQDKPAGIVASTGGIPWNTINSEMVAAHKAGVRISISGPGDYPVGGSSPATGGFGGPAQWAQDGKLVSAEVLTKGGAKPNVLLVEDSAVPVFAPLVAVIKKMIPAGGGTISVLQTPLSGLGTQDSQLIVSYLRAHPQTKDVILGIDDYLEGLPPALAAADLATSVKLYGAFSIPTSMLAVKNGQLQSTIIQEDGVSGWRGVDQILRSLAGDPIPDPDPAGAAQIVDKANVAAAMKLNLETFPYPNLAAEAKAFRAAWGVH
jgi:ABC-type sugar transport system substrate-binding protein